MTDKADFLNIVAVTAIGFDITMQEEYRTRAGYLCLDGGDWIWKQDGGRVFVAAGRVHWSKALAACLTMLEKTLGRQEQ